MGWMEAVFKVCRYHIHIKLPDDIAELAGAYDMRYHYDSIFMISILYDVLVQYMIHLTYIQKITKEYIVVLSNM